MLLHANRRSTLITYDTSSSKSEVPCLMEGSALNSLNSSLQTLIVIFPDIQPEVFREMLPIFSGESSLQIVTEQILQHKAKWVRGRWRVSQAQDKELDYRCTVSKSAGQNSEGLPVSESFRSTNYKNAVRSAFYQEFKGLSHSTIKAVLAEQNHCYLHARPILLALAAKSWRFSLTSLFLSRKRQSANEPPMVVVRQSDSGILEPYLVTTSSSELDKELYEAFILPKTMRRIEEQILQDASLADQLNNDEAERADALFECECCFVSSSFERIVTCGAGGHYICFRCIQHTMSEALYGQGWAKSVSIEKCSLRCLAVTNERECHGTVSYAMLIRVLEADQLRRFEDRITTESLPKDTSSATCPSCQYMEFRDIPGPKQKMSFWLLRLVSIFMACVAFMTTSGITQAFIAILLLGESLTLFRQRQSQQSLKSLPRPEHGQRFTCRRCSKTSCLSCKAAWHDIHICHESRTLSLRQHIEAATTAAIKRTCPKCNLSFIKDSGCNKLACVCGYQMCYVCRKEIGRETYKHFCPHFRPNPGEQCLECNKCDLYKLEDDEAVVKRAREEAEKQWSELVEVGGGHASLLARV